MAESRAHKRAKQYAAGRGGYTEVRLDSGRRLDALTRDGYRGTEVETSGSFGRLSLAAERLEEADTPQKVLKVPRRDMRFAAVVLRRAGISAWVEPMDGSPGFYVKTGRKRRR